MFTGSRLITLPKLLRRGQICFNEAYVRESMALVMFGRIGSKKADRLYPFYVPADVRVSRTTDMFFWLGILQTYLQRYLADLVLTEAAKKVTQIRQQPEKEERNYGGHLEEYAAACSSVYSDDSLVSLNVQGLPPTARITVTESLHRTNIDQPAFLSSVACLAQAEDEAYRARAALYEKWFNYGRAGNLSRSSPVFSTNRSSFTVPDHQPLLNRSRTRWW